MEWIFHIGIAQSLFSAFLLFTRKGNNLIDKILGTWMIFIFLELFHMLLEIIQSPVHAITSNFGFYSLTFGPFLYLYVSKLTSQDPVFKWNEVWHFIPYVLFSFCHLIFYTNRPLLSGDIELSGAWLILNMLRIVVLFVSLSVYSYLSLQAIQKHKNSIKDSFSFESSNITLNWLRHVAIIFIGTYIVLIVNMLTGNIAQAAISTSHYIPAFGLTFFCFSLSYYGFNQPVIFQKPGKNTYKNEEGAVELDDKCRQMHLNKLKSYLIEEKPYLNSELTITALAESVKLPRHYITEILKIDLKKNFFTLVNDYRIEEVKKRLINKEHKDDSVLQLAMESGFNSKSSFNALFKQRTGMTPSEYRRKES